MNCRVSDLAPGLNQARPADFPAIVASASIAAQATPHFSASFILTTLPPRIVVVERPLPCARWRASARCRRGAIAALAFHGKTSVDVVWRDN